MKRVRVAVAGLVGLALIVVSVVLATRRHSAPVDHSAPAESPARVGSMLDGLAGIHEVRGPDGGALPFRGSLEFRGATVSDDSTNGRTVLDLTASDDVVKVNGQRVPWKAPADAVCPSSVTRSAPQTCDGVSLVAGDVAFIPDGQYAGPWVVAAGAWARRGDFSASSDALSGSRVHVNRGSVYEHSDWYLQTASPIVLGTTALTWKRADGGVFSVVSFGAVGNANYQSPSNGKWYADAGYATEATDDAAAFQAAINAASAAGGGQVFVPAGGYYFKTPTGSRKQFIVPKSNVDLVGVGEASAIRIAPGLVYADKDAGADKGGYNVILTESKQTPVSRVSFRNFRIDENSAWNQFPSPPRSCTWHYLYGIAIESGADIVVDGVTVENANGDIPILVGQYASNVATQRARVSNCVLRNLMNDPNASTADQSAIGICGEHVTVNNNTVDNEDSNAYAKLVTTAYEVHGRDVTVTHNKARNVQIAMNVAAYSDDLVSAVFSGNVFEKTTHGFLLWTMAGTTMQDVVFADNVVSNRPNGKGFGSEFCFGDSHSGQSPSPTGLVGVTIERNHCRWEGGTPTGAYGVNFTSNGTNLTIRNNEFEGMPTNTIRVGPAQFAANSGNMLSGLIVTGNRIHNSGNNAILVAGVFGESADTIPSAEIRHNVIYDDQAEHTMATGVQVAAGVSRLLMEDNNITGYTTKDYLFTTSYGTATLAYVDKMAKTLSVVHGGINGSWTPGLTIANPDPATVAEAQYSPGLTMTAQGCGTSTGDDGGTVCTSQTVDWQLQARGGSATTTPSPIFNMAHRIGGSGNFTDDLWFFKASSGPFSIVPKNTSNFVVDCSASSVKCSVFAGSGGIELRATGSTIDNYVNSNRVLQLTDPTSGHTSMSLRVCTAGTAPDGGVGCTLQTVSVGAENSCGSARCLTVPN